MTLEKRRRHTLQHNSSYNAMIELDKMINPDTMTDEDAWTDTDTLSDTDSQYLSALDEATPLVTDIDLTNSHQPLTEFILFPDLPTEMRHKIFKHALTVKGDRVLHAGMTSSADTLDWVAKVQLFSGTPPWYLIDGERVSSNFDLGMLRACKESREIYLKVFKHQISLIYSFRGVFRYDDKVKIHITTLPGLVLYPSFIESVRLQMSLPVFFSTIKHLVVKMNFLQNAFSVRAAWGENTIPLIRAFSVLESLEVDMYYEYAGMMEKNHEGLVGSLTVLSPQYAVAALSGCTSRVQSPDS